MTTLPTTRSDQEIEDLPPPLQAVPELDPTDSADAAIGASSALALKQRELALLRPTGQMDKATWAPWRVRLSYAVAFVLVGVPIFFLMTWLRDISDPGDGTSAEVLDGLSFIWVLLALPVVLNVLGALTFRNGSKPTTDDRPITNPVCFRLVTRGTNVEAVLKSVHAVTTAMAQVPLFPFTVEVVTDRILPLPVMHCLTTILVPTDYQTPHATRFKARALHYALQVSPVTDTTWLFHLDEETHVTPSAVRGIRNAIVDEEASGELRIGQGVVLYHRDLTEHPFLTLADSVRTGDDLGRFRLQHTWGQTAFGMHGSFILVRNDVEKEVGFDLGPAGSVTEDAWWSLVEMTKGRRSRWIDGYCLEQSTRSVMDFVKQRRRWFIGLCLVCLHAPARLWHRIALVSSVLVWGVGWLGWWGISVAVIVFNVRIPYVVFLIGTVSLTAYSALYVLGLELNLEQRGVSPARRVIWHLLQLVFLPLFSLLEGSAVVYGVVRPDTNFHIVKK